MAIASGASLDNSVYPNGSATGYFDPLYSQSLSEFGAPRYLAKSRAWILERPIPNSQYLDAMGCYPVFVCEDWTKLHLDLDVISGSLVSFSLVTDPFGSYDVSYLRGCFPDVMRPFKDHFVVDLKRSLKSVVSAHHRRNTRKAYSDVAVKECSRPLNFLEDWVDLYKVLAERHQLRGITAFSADSFRKQLSVPGIVAFRAAKDGTAVGMVLWYALSNRAYYHLGAYSQVGYDVGASFALFDYAIRYFADHGFQWLDLGAGAGLDKSGNDGLSRFKKGWANGTRTAYFCGRIFDHHRYERLTAARGISNTNYFPAYRLGEFA